MVTLIGRLCALCAVSTLCDMVLGDHEARGGLRMIGGLLMLHLTMQEGRSLFLAVKQADGLMEIFQHLLG